jgi:hypothetical protein
LEFGESQKIDHDIENSAACHPGQDGSQRFPQKQPDGCQKIKWNENQVGIDQSIVGFLRKSLRTLPAAVDDGSYRIGLKEPPKGKPDNRDPRFFHVHSRNWVPRMTVRPTMYPGTAQPQYYDIGVAVDEKFMRLMGKPLR